MTLPKRDWMEMTWQDIASAGETARWIAVLPLAAVEQHGPHLPLGVDSFIAEAYLARVHELLPADLPVTFLPLQRIGVRPNIVEFPGTLTLSAATVIRPGPRSARASRAPACASSSSSPATAAMSPPWRSVARDLRVRLGMLVVTVGWHRFGYPDGTFSSEEKKHGIHGGDIETSLMLAAMPRHRAHGEGGAGEPATVAMAQEFLARRLSPAGFAWMTQDLHRHRRGRRRHAGHRGEGRGRARPRGAGFRRTAARDRPLRPHPAARRAACVSSAYDQSPRIR